MKLAGPRILQKGVSDVSLYLLVFTGAMKNLFDKLCGGASAPPLSFMQTVFYAADGQSAMVVFSTRVTVTRTSLPLRSTFRVT